MLSPSEYLYVHFPTFLLFGNFIWKYRNSFVILQTISLLMSKKTKFRFSDVLHLPSVRDLSDYYPLILMGAGLLVIFFMVYVGPLYSKIGYLQSNHFMAYNLDSDWLSFFSAVFGGVHRYDFLLPVLMILVYLYKQYAKKTDFHDETVKRQDNPIPFEREIRVIVFFLLTMLPLRIIYFSLYTINYFTAGAEEPIEYSIRCSSYRATRYGSCDYALYVDIDDNKPYRLEVSKENYDDYHNGKLTKAIVYVRQGCLNYRFASKYEFKE